jgi:hypothetical protein
MFCGGRVIRVAWFLDPWRPCHGCWQPAGCLRSLVRRERSASRSRSARSPPHRTVPLHPDLGLLAQCRRRVPCQAHPPPVSNAASFIPWPTPKPRLSDTSPSTTKVKTVRLDRRPRMRLALTSRRESDLRRLLSGRCVRLPLVRGAPDNGRNLGSRDRH